MSKDFASLHTHTSYSKLDGMSKIPTFLDRVVELGMSSAGISDHGNMSGVIEFYREAKKRGVRPVLGQETYFTDDRLSRTGVAQHDKNGEIDGSSKLYYHLSTYAQDNEGYHNLIKLSSDAFINGYYRKPRADYETLELYGKGLIVGSGCLGGPVLQPLLHGNYDAALATAAKLQDIVGKENFFIELMRHGLPEEAKTNPSLISIAKQIGAPIYATQDTHYTHAHEHEHHDVLLCCNTGSQLNTPGRFRFASDQYYLKSPDEMYDLFSDYPEACTNTLVIAERCNVNFEFDTLHLPQFNVPEGFEDDNAYLRHLVMEKLTSRYPEPTDVVYERLNYELSVIESMGVSSYMLITWDVIEFLRREGMFTSPGRGCLTEETLVQTSNGLVKLGDIEAGDKVVSHTGAYKEVLGTHKYPIKDEPLLEIKSFYGGPEGVKMTLDHKVLVSTDGTENLEWVRAEELNVGDWMFVPSIERTVKDIDVIDLADYAPIDAIVGDEYIIEQYITNTPYPFSTKDVKRRYKIYHSQETLMEYLRNGWLDDENVLDSPVGNKMRQSTFEKINSVLVDGGFSSVSEWIKYVEENSVKSRKIKRFVSVDADFCDFIGRLCSNGWLHSDGSRYGVATRRSTDDETTGSLVQNVFGDTFSINDSKTADLRQYSWSSKTVLNFLRSELRDYKYTAQTKHLPYWMTDLPDEKLKAIRDGLWWGDGSYADRNCYTSTSWVLTNQLYTILRHLGIPSGFSEDNRIDKRDAFKNAGRSWKIVSGRNWGYSAGFSRRIEGGFLTKIHSIKEVECGEFVYDITVEDDHSYLTTSGIVHNSSAGSIICYILGITKVDPIKYGLIFERFLNPSRIALPDIDIDIEQGYRERAINYTVEKYGRENVAQIITFGTIKARKAVQDASRVLGYEPWVGARINKMMPPLISGFDTPLAACLEKQDKYADGYEAAADLRQEYAINPDAKLIIDTALGIEGAQRNIGVHAAAVVIGDRRLDDLVPLAVSDNGVVITQFEKNTIEDLGLLKMDFLGLKNLDILGYCERLIGNGFSLDDVPKDDANTYRMLSRGESIGCFQIESSGMRALLKELRPDNLNDISAVLALYRPGPMAQDWHTAYARRKNGSENALPFHYDAMDVLKETYFLAPYQEQVMALSQRFAGYNMTEADNLRKIMGKKLPEKMAAEREKFVKGCVDQGYDEELGTEVFNMIEGFSAYGFNKCLTGDTTVERASGNQYSPRTVSIVELYEKLQDRKSSWSQKFRDPKRGLKILALDDDGRIRPQRVKDVVFNGNKPVWRITLIDGKTITSTANHRHMTTVGWKETSEIGVGEELLVNDGLDGNRKRKWEVGYSVSSSEVVSIEYVGVQPTYDLEMDFSGHNFVANGIVTHNSHSMSYGFVTYWTAYLKANYPKEYMASLCTFAMDDLDKTALYLGEARRMGLKVYPPDVLKSELGCTVEEDGIRIGLGTLKGIGAGAAQEIIDIRKREGFSNIHDFARKVNPKAPALSALALSGALDAWGPRMGIAHVAKDLMAQVRKDAKKAAKSESLFDIFEYSEFEIPNIEFGWHEKLEKEKEVLGIYASGHPLEDYVEYVTSTSISDLKETQERSVREFVAIITKLEIKNTKSGNKMAFIDVEDLTGAVQVIAFQKTLNEFSHLLEAGSVVRITTKTGYDSYRDDNSYHLMSVEPISIKTSSTPGQPESRVTPFGIHVPRGFFQDDMKVLRLKSILNKHNGETPVEVYVSRTVKRDIGFDLGVNVCDNMIMEIKELFNVN